MTTRRFGVVGPTGDELVFNEVDAYGVENSMSVDGWDGSPDVRATDMDLPLKDGGMVLDGYRKTRILSVRGGIAHRDKATVLLARDRLLAAFDLLRTDGAFVAYDPDATKQAVMRRVAGIDTEWRGPVLLYETTFECADPYKYARDESAAQLMSYTAATTKMEFTVGSGTGLAIDLATGSGADLATDFTGSAGAAGEVEVENEGNRDVYPWFEVLGPASSSTTDVRISNMTTGQTVRFTGTIAAGETLIMDMAAAQGLKSNLPVTISGESRFSQWVAPRVPMSLPPGFSVMRFEVLAGQTDATLRMHWRSGWE